MASGPGRVIPVRNPRTGEYDTEIPAADSGAIAAWADQLRAAQGAWLARGAAGRAAILTRFADELQAQFSDLAEQLSVDTGRRTFAQFEVVRAIELLRHWAERIETELDAINDCGRSQQVASVSFSHVAIPYEVVAVISPWNVPLLLAMIDSAPALAAGCSVLLKPSEVTPRFIAPLQAALSRVPELAAVFRVVTGDAETGRAMIDRADAVCFTGSVATGRQVARQAAERFIPAFLELGGKDPALVLADADLDIAARAVIRSAVGMTGQACQSLERIYCHADVYDAFLATLLAQLDELSLTLSEDGSGDIAPLIFASQAETIQDQIDQAVARGARVLRGGNIIEAGGLWYPPTVVVDVSQDMALMQEETFGPVIPVQRFEDLDQAVALANDSVFGLSGAVFSRDADTAASVASRLQVGAVSINDASLTGVVNDVEKNSFRLSGMGGSRMGPAGLTRFLRKRALLFQEGEPASVVLFADPPV